ncbi:MAG TPA: N-acetyl-1-D-myo-inositol-2-amino-2-deoxy-alpha-D-glucopyranoside deacetylase [Jiangellales bacterium]|nr:N-acetyl-1-D-myo-inositol-2-amino-2-deoxy-alpha-D-glucopyranoside deacetylase [Jiangellales bacterium]
MSTPPAQAAPSGSSRRLLLVHAHPDDETTTTGATMAHHAALGDQVCLVTCTRGEEGEVLVEDLAHLSAAEQDLLGEHRETELAAAMAALGVTDYRFLGEPGEFRDSGMAGEPSNDHPAAFCRVAVDDAAARLVPVVRSVRPQVLVTYDPHGGYGHPDHIQAHRVAMRAVELAADAAYGVGEPWQVPKVYWCAWGETAFRAALRRMRESGVEIEGMDPDGELPPFVVPDDRITTVVDGTRWSDAKLRAMRCYPTQVGDDSPFFAFDDPDFMREWGRETYVLVRGEAHPDPEGADGRERDLFAGLS